MKCEACFKGVTIGNSSLHYSDGDIKLEDGMKVTFSFTFCPDCGYKIEKKHKPDKRQMDLEKEIEQNNRSKVRRLRRDNR